MTFTQTNNNAGNVINNKPMTLMDLAAALDAAQYTTTEEHFALAEAASRYLQRTHLSHLCTECSHPKYGVSEVSAVDSQPKRKGK